MLWRGYIFFDFLFILFGSNWCSRHLSCYLVFTLVCQLQKHPLYWCDSPVIYRVYSFQVRNTHSTIKGCCAWVCPPDPVPSLYCAIGGSLVPKNGTQGVGGGHSTDCLRRNRGNNLSGKYRSEKQNSFKLPYEWIGGEHINKSITIRYFSSGMMMKKTTRQMRTPSVLRLIIIERDYIRHSIRWYCEPSSSHSYVNHIVSAWESFPHFCTNSSKNAYIDVTQRHHDALDDAVHVCRAPHKLCSNHTYLRGKKERKAEKNYNLPKPIIL